LTLISLVNAAIAALKNDVESVLVTDHTPKYSVKVLLRDPDRSDRFPFAVIIPMEIVPKYFVRDSIENAILTIRLILIVRKPFDDDGTELLSDLDTVLEKLYTLRHNTDNWRELDYKQGIRFGTDITDKDVYQSAEITINIEIN